jgi:hypothetical protein
VLLRLVLGGQAVSETTDGQRNPLNNIAPPPPTPRITEEEKMQKISWRNSLPVTSISNRQTTPAHSDLSFIFILRLRL